MRFMIDSSIGRTSSIQRIFEYSQNVHIPSLHSKKKTREANNPRKRETRLPMMVFFSSKKFPHENTL